MIRKKAISKLLVAMVVVLSSAPAIAQCNYQLVEEAAQQAGSNTVFLRDFKVQLSEASMDDPVPTGRFPVYLNRDVQYRFTVANAADLAGKAHVEIVRRGQVYATNQIPDTSYVQSFDFMCERSATYQILINFGQGNQGCAAVVMSLVLQDSLTYIEPGVPLETDSLETLHLWAENEMQIATPLGANYSVVASASQGAISTKGKYFYVKPEHIGALEIYVRILDIEGKEVEVDTAFYEVELPPLPQIVLPGEQAGTLSLRNIMGQSEVELRQYFNTEKPFYYLKQFAISGDANGFSSLTSYDKFLTAQQVAYIRKLKPGDKIFVVQPKFIDRDKNLHTGGTRQIIIVE